MAGTNHLRKFATTFYQDKTASDSAQIPAAGAQVTIYKQGATKQGNTTVTTAVGGVSCQVRSVGRLVVGDIVTRNGTGTTMSVESITSDTFLNLRASSGTVALGTGDRLVCTTPLTAVLTYTDSDAFDLAPNPYTLGSEGLFEIYTPEAKFDMIANGVLYIDNDGGWMRGGGTRLNVKDYPTPQACLNALPSGVRGEIYFPAGTYDFATYGQLVTNTTNTHIVGEKGFTTFTGTANTSFIYLKHANCSVSGIDFLNSTPGSGTGVGILIRAEDPSNPGTYVENSNQFIEGCTFDGMGKYGIDISAGNNHSSYFFRCIDTDFTNCYQGNVRICDVAGFAGSSATTHFFERCHFHNSPGGTLGTYTGGLTKGGVHIRNAYMIEFNNCYFENFNCGTAVSFETDNCYSIDFNGCGFEFNSNSGTDLQEWMITSSATLNNVQWRNCFVKRVPTVPSCSIRFFKNVTNPIQSSSVIGCYFLTNSAAPGGDDFVLAHANDYISFISNKQETNGGAQRDITMTDKGGNTILGMGTQGVLKIPRLANTAAVTNPVDGMIIIDLSESVGNKVKVRMDGAWKKVNVATGWV